MEEKRRMNEKRISNKQLRFFGVLLLIITMSIVVSLIVPRIFNMSPYVIISESMYPELKVNDVVYVKAIDLNEVKEGDIISFYMNSNALTPVTHRVVSNDISRQQFVTKGDANEKNDIIPIAYEYVLGKVMFKIPFLGAILLLLESLAGKIVFIIMFLAGVVLIEVSRK
ncbi:MAG: signal peptidase I [Erysipelotrichaceae bacterium]|nr:signal peptidase I [Erysipelotrichaceae bacterium]